MIDILAEALIIEAADKLGATGGQWASITDVRKTVSLTREQFDRAAYRLAVKGTVTLAPEDNQKTLTAADREAALFIGEPRHLITVH